MSNGNAPRQFRTLAADCGRCDNEPRLTPQPQVAASSRSSSVDDLLPSLILYFGCVIERVPDGLLLRGAGPPQMNAAALTPQTFRPPFTLKTTARTDSTNLRLYWHVGEVILNWECDVRQLRIHHPDTGRQVGLDGQGFIRQMSGMSGLGTAAHHDATHDRPSGPVRGRWRVGDINAPLAIGPMFREHRDGAIVRRRAAGP